MKKQLLVMTKGAIYSCILVYSSHSHAQTATANPPPVEKVPVETVPAEKKPTFDNDELLVLTPFEVTASKDVGYQATDTLAGTRIRTDLRDVGSSISVATKELMSDIGATDSQTLLQFMGNAEVGGSKGNFLVGSSVGDASTIDESAALLKPQGNTRVRGLTAADNTRDYFLTDIPWDGFNISRIELQRGPNSILFGNGSGAGIINAGSDSASFGNNDTNIDLRTASYGSYRASLNLNRELFKNELAIRFAALNDKRFYQQKPAFNHDRRLYGAIRYEPKFLKLAGSRTTIKLSYENGQINANRPRLTTMNDGISPWFLKAPVELRSPTSLGRPAGLDDTLLGVMRPMVSHDGYDPFVTQISGTQLTTLRATYPTRTDIGARQPFSATNPNAEGWLGAVIKPTDSGASQTGNGIDNGGLSYWLAEYDNANSSTLSRYVYPSASTNNSVGTTGVRDGGSITGMRGPDITGIMRLDQYAFRGVGSFLYTLQGVWRSKTITDPSFFDFYHKLIDGPNKSEKSKFDVFNASLDQTFLNGKLGFQLAYDRQAYADYRYTNLGNPTIRIDIYKYLPVALLNPSTGALEPVLNPNFGRPFIVSKPSTGRSRTARDVGRFTPFANLNFEELFKSQNWAMKILGRHSFTGLYEINRYERRTSSWIPYTLDETQANDIFYAGNQVNSDRRSVGTVTYLGPSLATADSMSGANISAITAVQKPGTSATPNAWYFDSHYTSATSPSAAFTPLALGLGANQVGGNATTANENPLNYGGWGSAPRTLNVTTADSVGEHDLSTSYTRYKTKTTSMALVDQWMMLDRHIVVTAGLRKDKIDTFYPGDPSLDATSPLRSSNRLQDITTGLVRWDLPFTYASSPTMSFTSDWLKTYGVVMHAPNYVSKHLPWGLRPSVFFNSSENFQPVTRRDAITGADLTPPQGKTREIGFALASANRRFSIKCNWYETKVKNASMPDNGVIGFTADELYRGIQYSKVILYAQDINNGTNISGSNPSLSVGTVPTNPNGNPFYRPLANTSGSSTNLDPTSTHWYPWQPSRGLLSGQSWTLQEWKDAEAHAVASANAFLDSLNTPTAQSLLSMWQMDPNNWNINVANFGMTSVTPSGVAITGDTVSKGTELELFFSPVDGWDITMNAAKTFATRKNLAGNMGNWLQNRWSLYNEAYTGNDGSVWVDGSGQTVAANTPGATLQGYSGLLAGGLRWFGGGQGNANSGNARFGRNGYRYYSEFYSKEGNNVPELRPWRFNAVTSYRFKRGALKGAFVGLSYRWEDKSIIGYGVTETTPERFAGATSLTAAMGKLDVDKPFYGPTESHWSAWVGYGMRTWKKIDWRIQLNVNNLGEKNRLIPLTVNPDGSGAAYRIAEGTTWELKNTFKL